MKRRDFLTFAGTGLSTSIVKKALAGGDGPARLVLVHGRSQQGFDPAILKSTWLETLRHGATKINRTLPDQLDVAFPFYGKTLDDFARQFEIPLTTDIQTKGSSVNNDFLSFQAEVAEQMRSKAGITDSQVQDEFGATPTEKGPQNWAWVQAIIRTIDRNAGGVTIDSIVATELDESPCVVIGHSLGSVVAYHVLRTDQRALNVRVFVTVGSPLAIRAIRDRFRPIEFPTARVWYNAFDPRDVVALYPLDATNFPISPAVENYGKVLNGTDNRHGIVGYLDDVDVAKHVLDGLGV